MHSPFFVRQEVTYAIHTIYRRTETAGKQYRISGFPADARREA